METKVNNSIPTLIKLAREEQTSLKQLSDKISIRQDVINKVIELLEGPVFDDSFKLPLKNNFPQITNQTDRSKIGIKEQYYNYPRKGSKHEKVKYILHKEWKAMRSSEIQDMIMKIEGVLKSKETLKSFHSVLNYLSVRKQILAGKVANSKRHIFYILPEFLDNNNRLKHDHYPKEESWGKLEDEKREMIADCFSN